MKRGQRLKPIPTDAAERIRALASRGVGVMLMAESFGVSHVTFRKWLAENEELEAARTTGRAVAEKAVYNRLWEIAMSNGPQALTAAIFIAKTQFGWNDRPEGDATEGRPVVQINIVAPCSPETYRPPVLAKEPAVIEHQ